MKLVKTQENPGKPRKTQENQVRPSKTKKNAMMICWFSLVGRRHWRAAPFPSKTPREIKKYGKKRTKLPPTQRERNEREKKRTDVSKRILFLPTQTGTHLAFEPQIVDDRTSHETSLPKKGQSTFSFFSIFIFYLNWSFFTTYFFTSWRFDGLTALPLEIEEKKKKRKKEKKKKKRRGFHRKIRNNFRRQHPSRHLDVAVRDLQRCRVAFHGRHCQGGHYFFDNISRFYDRGF